MQIIIFFKFVVEVEFTYVLDSHSIAGERGVDRGHIQEGVM